MSTQFKREDKYINLTHKLVGKLFFYVESRVIAEDRATCLYMGNTVVI